MDLSKLTPAPWNENDDGGVYDDSTDRNMIGEFGDGPPTDKDIANAYFAVLARNDLDVKLRRGWHTEKCKEVDQWIVPQLIANLFGKSKEEFAELIKVIYQEGHDVGLLTKADAWYAKHVEKKEKS